MNDGLFGPGIFGTGIDLSALDDDTAWRLGQFMGEQLTAARAAGWADAVKALRDRDRYEAWVAEDRGRPLSADGARSFWPDAYHAPRFADYLEAVAARAIESDQTTTQDGEQR